MTVPAKRKWTTAILILAFSSCSHATIGTARLPTDVLDRRDLGSPDTVNLVATVRQLRPSWFRGNVQILVDQEPVPIDTVLQIPTRVINQIVYYEAARAVAIFREAEGQGVVSVLTIAGPSDARAAWTAVPPPRVPIETRAGLSVGFQQFDSLSGPAVDASLAVIGQSGLAFAAGLHHSTQVFRRTFPDGTVADPGLQLRYLFLEPRFYFGRDPDMAPRPYIGVRVLGGHWQVRIAHPSDPQPPEQSDVEMGLGVVGGITLIRWNRLAFDIAADYSRFNMDLFLTNLNPVYRPDQPVRADGRILKLKSVVMLRW